MHAVVVALYFLIYRLPLATVANQERSQCENPNAVVSKSNSHGQVDDVAFPVTLNYFSLFFDKA